VKPHCPRILLILLAIVALSQGYGQTLIINEVSNGPAGNQEFVEFVVVSNSAVYSCNTNVPPCIDIRGWIIDDNSGYHGGVTGTGVAPGAVRFSNAAFWSCIPLGTIIVVYNNNDPNTSLPAQDLSMTDGNCRLVIPINNTSLFESNSTTPGAVACSYPTTGWTPGGNWNNTVLANSGDCMRIVDLGGCEVFSLCYGSANTNNLIYFAGSGADQVWFFNNGNPNILSNWSAGCADPVACGSNQQTPGSANNPLNAAYIAQFNIGCQPITPVTTALVSVTPAGCICDGAAAVSGSGSIGGYTYTWYNSTGTVVGIGSSLTNACAGSYSVVTTSSIGCTDSITLAIPSSTAIITPTFTQVAPICNGGTFTLPTSSINGISGMWSPAINNTTTTTTYTFTPTTGQCATTATMSVTVNQPVTPTFTQIAQICNGGSFTLPLTSNNSITGTWSPAVNNTTTTTYTFTPATGACATTATMTVSVGPPVTPTFTQVAPICSGGSFTLPTTSLNGINGTWSPAVNNTVTTTYTFTPAAGACATTTTMSVTVNPNITPTFTQVAAICSGGSFTLPTASLNAINGTWSPAVNNTATTTYTFTPTAGTCATTATMSVTVNQPVTPTFTQVAPICNGGTISLPTTSNNSITGTWSPAVNNAATTTYTFTPTAGQCATTATMTVTVNQPVTPTFPSAGPFCLNDVLPQVMLPTTSLNGINGTWNPGMLSTATAGTFTYTFTPDASECALPYSMTVTVNDPIVPTFNQLAPLCSGANFTLPTTSTNSISGSWSPAINNMATTTYTFTPNAGICATTATMTVEIGAQILPSFVPDVTTGCIPLTVNFTNTSANSVNCSWNFGNGTSQAGCGPVSATFTSAGCYDITLTVTDINGCSGTLTANNLICVEDAPDVSFNPSTGVISQLNTTVNFNNTTTGAVSYDWDFGDNFGSVEFEPTHTYPDEPNGYTVTLIATSAAGCIDSASTVIQYNEELIFYIPNTFTPDDDMYNQTFKPVFTSGFDPYDYNMFIYNRWGELIFESKDANFGWDGTYGVGSQNRKAQDGAYTWKIEFKTLQSDERKRVTGHVNLIR
jgi:gliding motility-associated-like protein